MKWLALRMARIAIAWHMKGHGYTREQRQRLLGQINWSKVWEVIKTYGPIILSVFVKYILPLLLALEQPQGEPIKDYWLHEDEEMEHAAEANFNPNQDTTDLE